MTTYSTSAPISQSNQANFNAWISEIAAGLFTNCGLVQTQDSGQLAIPTTTAVYPTGANQQKGYYVATFSDTLAQGGITTTALVAGGSGYTSGTQTGLIVTGVTSGATSARATCVVSGGVGANLTITTAGSGYIAGEKLTVNLAGGGSGYAAMPTVLSSGSPIVFRLDFGSGNATADPQVLITVGSGSNGSGTINGSAGTTAMTQCATMYAGAISNIGTIAMISRYCVNMTLGASNNGGHVFMAFKYAGQSAINYNVTLGGFHIFRSNDTSGNPSGASVALITNSASTTGSGAAPTPQMQCAVFGSGVFTSVYPLVADPNRSSAFTSIPVLNTSPAAAPPLGGNGSMGTLTNGVAQVFPNYIFDGVAKLSAYSALGSQNEAPVGSTASIAIIGATQITYLSAGNCFGNNDIWSNYATSNAASTTTFPATYLVPWF